MQCDGIKNLKSTNAGDSDLTNISDKKSVDGPALTRSGNHCGKVEDSVSEFGCNINPLPIALAKTHEDNVATSS